MNSPAITIHPDAPLGAAAQLLNAHRIRRLPVVGADKELIGMVSRRDLLSVFLRPDRDVAVDVADELSAALETSPMRVVVSVADGEVRLAGEMPDGDAIREAVKVAARVDGVVAVHDHLAVGLAVRG
jgi:CBS-domain-containing membrane protein